MRISDWSSDVCSSDLLLSVAAMGGDGGRAHAVTDDVAEGGDRRAGTDEGLVDELLQAGRLAEPAATLLEVDPGEPEIELAAEEGHRIRLLGRQLLEQLVAERLDQVLVGCGGAGAGVEIGRAHV